jgi:hypothetical protein
MKNYITIASLVIIFSFGFGWMLWMLCFIFYVFGNSPTIGDFAPFWLNLNKNIFFDIFIIINSLYLIYYKMKR